jgi:hypothetical protein
VKEVRVRNNSGHEIALNLCTKDGLLGVFVPNNQSVLLPQELLGIRLFPISVDENAEAPKAPEITADQCIEILKARHPIGLCPDDSFDEMQQLAIRRLAFLLRESVK